MLYVNAAHGPSNTLRSVSAPRRAVSRPLPVIVALHTHGRHPELELDQPMQLKGMSVDFIFAFGADVNHSKRCRNLTSQSCIDCYTSKHKVRKPSSLSLLTAPCPHRHRPWCEHKQPWSKRLQLGLACDRHHHPYLSRALMCPLTRRVSSCPVLSCFIDRTVHVRDRRPRAQVGRSTFLKRLVFLGV